MRRSNSSAGPVLGCRFAQGYFLGRPQAPEALQSLLAREPALRSA